MSTQKTGMGDGSIPPKDPELEEQNTAATTDDLGIPEDVYIDDDPTGYVPDVPVEEVAGRRVRRISGEHLEEAHSRYAGRNVKMDGQLKGPPNPTEQPVGEQTPHQPTATTATEARRLMPDAYKNQPQQEAPPPQYGEQPANAPINSPTAAAPVAETAAAQLRIGKKEAEAAAMSFEYLSEAEREAVRAGDYGSAAQAKLMSEQLAKEYNVKQRSEMKQEHPALTKLLTNLGLKKIKRTSIPWGGSDWMFSPTNAELDYWVARTMDAAGMNVNALSISAGLVGLDEVPLYKVLNIPLKKTHVVTAGEAKDEDGQECRIIIYKKYCHCGNQIEVDVENCPICDAAQDIFDMPLDLRMVCAQRFNEVLSTEFGAYESLGQLVDLRAEQMKDRRFDAEELYPLVTPSSKEETTQD